LFGLFNGRHRRQVAEQEKRVTLFYQQCVDAIETYVQNTPDPIYDDILRIAINAKIFYELFKQVDGLKSKVRDFTEPYVMGAPEAIVQLEGLDIEAAAAKALKIFDAEIEALINNQSKLILPPIKSAYLMSILIGFHQLNSSIT